jgi:hypothetical protein
MIILIFISIIIASFYIDTKSSIESQRYNLHVFNAKDYTIWMDVPRAMYDKFVADHQEAINNDQNKGSVALAFQ